MIETSIAISEDVDPDVPIVVTAKERIRRLTSEATRRRIAAILRKTMPIPDALDDEDSPQRVDWNVGSGEDQDNQDDETGEDA